MHPQENMTETISGKRYTVETATLLASDEYWDGNNFEKGGRNHFLYRTPKGNFFVVNLTQWIGERDTLLPLSQSEALELWESLPEKEVEVEDAFPGLKIEEA